MLGWYYLAIAGLSLLIATFGIWLNSRHSNAWRRQDLRTRWVSRWLIAVGVLVCLGCLMGWATGYP